MINRYQGNSGRVERFPESGRSTRAAEGAGYPAAASAAGAAEAAGAPAGCSTGLRYGRLLPDKIGELETDDIILLLILYLMYREGGDSGC